jgi:pyridoxal phosphate enzyme (YggS family)
VIQERLEILRAKINQACERSGRSPDEVRLLAVSKGHPASAIAEAWQAGLRDFGENYVQDWNQKAEDPQLLQLEGLRWHFIGALQRNKIRFLLGRVSTIGTVDRWRLASELGRRAQAEGRTQRVLLQVNLGQESSKSGFGAEDLHNKFGELKQVEGLDIQGLMAIPPRRSTPEETRLDHRALSELREELQQRWSHPLPELSMGMSSDFEVAIEEGSTEVRLGTALFGDRPPRT